jgi:hypothetical protein
MARFAAVVASSAVLCVGVAAYARARVHDEPLDPSKGVKLSSRLPCDGATNPQDEIHLHPTFSPGSWERSFRITVFEQSYCKRMDLGFACLMPGHARWKVEWSADSSSDSSAAGSTARSADSSQSTDANRGLDSCSDWGSKDPPQYILTGWYREGGSGSKLPWKQAALQPVSSRWETYEFADPQGGTARLEIGHP